ncbi:MAG: alpha/beta hydrolase [Thomasclavelia sp.]|nr:alpha/beta hydrolase [Thomasclavelia sp.]
MKVKDFNLKTFPSYDKDIDGAVELYGKEDNLRVRMMDVDYQKGCRIRILYPNTIFDEDRIYPVVIHDQGSGWYKQDMNDHIFDFMPIVKAGYIYAIVETHYAPDSKFPTHILDFKKAIRFIQKNYQKYNMDINNVFLSGDSSGGHVALMTLFTYDSHEFDKEDTPLLKLKGMIDLYGISNFLTLNDWYSKHDWTEDDNARDFLGNENTLDKNYLAKVSPISYIKENLNLPPIIILHGSKDVTIPFTQSLELYHKLKEYNYDVTIARVNKASHGRSIFYCEDVYNFIINFLNKNTK